MLDLISLVKQQSLEVDNEKWRYYYQADGYKFKNIYLAEWYEKTHNSWATFVAQPFDQIQNTLNTETFDFNIEYDVKYLKELRENHERLCLMFSGGADSLTVLKKAADNDIFIDELISFASGDELYIDENKEIYENAIPAAEKFKGKYGKFTIKRKTLKDYNSCYQDLECFFKHPEAGSLYPMFRRMWNHHEPLNGTAIFGPDKPQLAYYNQRWYTVLLDTSFNGHYALDSQAVFFNFEPENIFSLIKDSILYRDYLLENNLVDSNKKLLFFKPLSRDENTAIGRVNSINEQYNKNFNTGVNIWNHKDQHALIEATKKQDLKLLCNYYKSIDQLLSIYPEYNYTSRNFSPAKFGWFIDIDDLKIYTQTQLLPNGFEL